MARVYPLTTLFGALRLGFLATISVAIAGCDDTLNSAEKLKGCIASTEQTVLLRQLALGGKAKESFDACPVMYGITYCRGLYLNANGVVRQCMNDAGYIFSDIDFYLTRKENPYKTGNINVGGTLKDGICSWENYQDPICYHFRWLFVINNPWAL
jgi:hypothetical protein